MDSFHYWPGNCCPSPNSDIYGLKVFRLWRREVSLRGRNFPTILDMLHIRFARVVLHHTYAGSSIWWWYYAQEFLGWRSPYYPCSTLREIIPLIVGVWLGELACLRVA